MEIVRLSSQRNLWEMIISLENYTEHLKKYQPEFYTVSFKQQKRRKHFSTHFMRLELPGYQKQNKNPQNFGKRN